MYDEDDGVMTIGGIKSLVEICDNSTMIVYNSRYRLTDVLSRSRKVLQYIHSFLT